MNMPGPGLHYLECSQPCERLDVFVAGALGVTRSHAQGLIKGGCVSLNGKKAKPSLPVATGDTVEVLLPEPEPLEAAPENIAIDIVYQDADIAVINKPKGMVVHPAAGNRSGTLVNALLYHIGDLSGINSVVRPGIVHRLDKDTSGLLVVAKNDAAHVRLAKQIKERTASRVYSAIALGNVKEDEGEIIAPIARHPSDRKRMAVVPDGKIAHTRYRVVERFSEATLLELQLVTGRTHQIRVHLAHIGHGVLGDPVYGPKRAHYPIEGQALHAGKIAFDHPRTGERMEFTSPLPADFIRLMEWLRARKGLR
ncbi:MAG: RluA family pseudouridine synthase [Bacillota bacterium]